LFNCYRICFFIVFFSFAVSADVFINQEGYLPNGSKYVFVNQVTDSFFVRNSITNQILFSEQLQLFIASDPGTGLLFYRGDFSSFQLPGNHYIEIKGGDISKEFSISDSVYIDVYRKSLKSFYYQRCGVDLLGPTAIPYFRTRGHVADGFYHSSSGYTGFHLASKGWHDGGDYGKYIVNAGITVGTLLMAYEEFPSRFNQDNINIYESGNGIPDILDELRFELEWMLKMQDSTGGVYHKLTRENFAEFVMPSNDIGTRYIYQISSAATGDFAAVMARAFRVFWPIDSTFAQICLSAAESAWTYLMNHPNIVPPGGFQNPSGTSTGTYGDGDDRDERLWASAALYISTGDSLYHAYYTNNYSQKGLINSQMGWSEVQAMAHLTYLRGSQTGINSLIQNQLRNSLLNYCQNLVNIRNNTGFHVVMSNSDYVWGSNSIPLNRALLLIIGYEEFNNIIYLNVALDQLHYVLGANAHSLSFVTGTGSTSPMFPHHRPSAADGIVDPIPGLIVGGPDRHLSDPVLQANFSTSTPPALCYIDDQGSYASNEIAINWNAPLVFVTGYFGSENNVNSININNPKIPQNLELLQNYPNPFNGNTMIRFNIKYSDTIFLEIFDITGKNVLSKNLGKLNSGEASFIWNAVTKNGARISSGIYYYVIKARRGEKSQIKKMVYIK
jgi:endoglucanase